MVVQTSSAMAENIENYLDALNDLQRNTQSKDIPEELEQLLCRIAQNGEPIFPWHQLKPLVVIKLESVLQDYVESSPNESMEILPNVENIEFKDMRERLLQTINAFTHAPFTIQRLCELLTEPRRYYQRSDKFMRGIEKNVQVVSTVTSGGKRITSSSSSSHSMQSGTTRTSAMVNGITDSNGSNGLHANEGDKTDDDLDHPTADDNTTTSSSFATPSKVAADSVSPMDTNTGATKQPQVEGDEDGDNLSQTASSSSSPKLKEFAATKTDEDDVHRTQSNISAATTEEGGDSVSKVSSSTSDLTRSQGSGGDADNVIPEAGSDDGRTSSNESTIDGTSTSDATTSGTTAHVGDSSADDKEAVITRKEDGETDERVKEEQQQESVSSSSSSSASPEAEDSAVKPEKQKREVLAQGDSSESEPAAPTQFNTNPTASGDQGSADGEAQESSVLPQEKPSEEAETLQDETRQVGEGAKAETASSPPPETINQADRTPSQDAKLDSLEKVESQAKPTLSSSEDAAKDSESCGDEQGTAAEVPPPHGMEVDNETLEPPTTTTVVAATATAAAEPENMLQDTLSSVEATPSDDNNVPSVADAVPSLDNAPTEAAVASSLPVSSESSSEPTSSVADDCNSTKQVDETSSSATEEEPMEQN